MRVGRGTMAATGWEPQVFARNGHRDHALPLEARIKGDGNFRKLKTWRRGTDILWAYNDPGYVKLREQIRRSELIIDALLGTGAALPIDGQLAQIMAVVKDEIIARGRQNPKSASAISARPAFPSWKR